MTSQVADSAGRIFQNPSNRHEIWINIGLYEEHYTTLSKYPRIYPPHDPLLHPHLPKETFDALIALLRDHVEAVIIFIIILLSSLLSYYYYFYYKFISPMIFLLSHKPGTEISK